MARNVTTNHESARLRSALPGFASETCTKTPRCGWVWRIWMMRASRYLIGQAFELVHSTSSGRSQGNQTGMGFNDRHGAGNSMDLHVPGMQTDAVPKLSQGRILNSVLMSVGQIGTSKGTEMDPTVSGGTGGSGRQGRGPQPPPRHSAGPNKRAETTIKTSTKQRDLISIPRKPFAV